MAVAPHAGGAAGTLTYFAAPMAGAKTVMLEEFDPRLALEVMAKEKVTAIGVVPTHLVRMLEQDIESFDLSSLRLHPLGRRLSASQGGLRGRGAFRGGHHLRPGHPGRGFGERLPGHRFGGGAAWLGGPSPAGQRGQAVG